MGCDSMSFSSTDPISGGLCAVVCDELLVNDSLLSI